MPADRANRSAPLRARRVLAVDDDPDICRMIATVLEGAGAQVDARCSGADAQGLLAEQEYDAVLLDWNLNDMAAADFLERAERCRRGATSRVVVMTGDLIRRLDTHEAERRGMPLLRKPFRPKDLIEAVVRIVGAAQP